MIALILVHTAWAETPSPPVPADVIEQLDTMAAKLDALVEAEKLKAEADAEVVAVKIDPCTGKACDTGGATATEPTP